MTQLSLTTDAVNSFNQYLESINLQPIAQYSTFIQTIKFAESDINQQITFLAEPIKLAQIVWPYLELTRNEAQILLKIHLLKKLHEQFMGGNVLAVLSQVYQEQMI